MDIGFRKTALKKQGAFTPARQGMRVGVEIVSKPPQPPKTVDKQKGAS